MISAMSDINTRRSYSWAKASKSINLIPLNEQVLYI